MVRRRYSWQSINIDVSTEKIGFANHTKGCMHCTIGRVTKLCRCTWVGECVVQSMSTFPLLGIFSLSKNRKKLTKFVIFSHSFRCFWCRTMLAQLFYMVHQVAIMNWLVYYRINKVVIKPHYRMNHPTLMITICQCLQRSKVISIGFCIRQKMHVIVIRFKTKQKMSKFVLSFPIIFIIDVAINRWLFLWSKLLPRYSKFIQNKTKPNSQDTHTRFR